MAIDGLYYVHAFVSDLERAKAFYGTTLGWGMQTDAPGVAGFWFGTGYLVAIEDPRDDGERRYAGGMHIAVKVDDLDAEHARLADQGVEVTPIQERPWGERNFSFSDPDGYLWEYGQPTV